MPEENEESQDDSMEEEMARLMEQEAAGGAEGAEDAEAADGGDDAGGLEAEMLQAMVEEAGGSEEGSALPVDPMSMMPDVGGQAGDTNQMLDVKLPVSIELGETKASISAVLDWTEGSLIELSKVSGEAVDVKVNGKPYAKGEVVTIAENFGVRITELLPIVHK